MGKVLAILALLGLTAFYLLTLKYPNNTFLLFSNGTQLYQNMRELLCIALFLQVITKPPRHVIFRIATSLLSVGVLYWLVNEIIVGTMLPFDVLIFLAAGISIGIISLEGRRIPKLV
jgi:hypothetical protein